MVNVLTTGAVKQLEVTDPITTCCGAEQSPYARILVHRLAAGTFPLAGIYQRSQPCAAIPSPDGRRLSMSRLISFNCQSAHPRLHARGHHQGRRGAKAAGLDLIGVSRSQSRSARRAGIPRLALVVNAVGFE